MNGSHDELMLVRDLVARLAVDFPSVDVVTVEATVRAAHDAFRQARVRAYVPILIERRSRKVLRALCLTAPALAPVPAPHPVPPAPGPVLPSASGPVLPAAPGPVLSGAPEPVLPGAPGRAGTATGTGSGTRTGP
ncbi:three-helix bundle dimerization domain-containing protein [Streptomyces sp. NPDC008159]|uniref:three-helix bundle dimerization domain-containing protein n=1 Tax=Streptomyces sp. NPDC008159 TaxID=3364817 RepID=UPI0036EC35EE